MFTKIEQELATGQKSIIPLNPLYCFLSHAHFYFQENANLRIPPKVAIFFAEISALLCRQISLRKPIRISLEPSKNCSMLRKHSVV